MTKLVFNKEYEPTLPGLNSPLEEGEPVFVLRAGDTLAPGFAALWASLRKGETVEAVNRFAAILSGPADKYVDNTNYNDTQKARSALAKAYDMNEWRAEKALPTFKIK